MNNNDTRPLMVSIWCITYNHEPYIRQCLEGFVMQKTNFRFEAIVHDDASTDGTADIVREYAEKYPDIIKPIIETENQYSKGDGSLERIMDETCTGKYIAICEGDDYWIDPLKLQKQVDIMEKHPDCSLTVSNNCSFNMEDGIIIEAKPIPIKESRFLTMSEVLREEGGLISTASMCFRADLLRLKPAEFGTAYVGDRPLRMWLAINGSVYYEVHPMTVYRVGSVDSFSQRSAHDTAFAKDILTSMNAFYVFFDRHTNYNYHADVEYLKSRELFIYYTRTGNKKRFFTGYFKSLPFNKKLKIVICYMLDCFSPQLLSRLLKIKLSSKKIIKEFSHK